MVTHQRDPLHPWGSPQHLRADGGHPSWPPVNGEGVSGLAGSAAQPTGRERAPPKSLWLSHPVSLMNGPAPQALSACKGQLQRLLQGVKPAAGGSAGEKSLFRVQLCRGKAKVPGRAPGDGGASAVRGARGGSSASCQGQWHPVSPAWVPQASRARGQRRRSPVGVGFGEIMPEELQRSRLSHRRFNRRAEKVCEPSWPACLTVLWGARRNSTHGF